MPESPSRGRPTSRLLHAIDEIATRPVAALVVSCGVLAMFIVIVINRFDVSLQASFATVSSGITLSMVFALQHTQRRAQKATQLKLDELLRALPQANDRVVRIEAASDEELLDVEDAFREHHDSVRGSGPWSSG
jgi:low affinity Fe/Cu permease